MFIVPASGRKVRYPGEGTRYLAEAGDEVERSIYWTRRLLAGDVSESPPETRAAWLLNEAGGTDTAADETDTYPLDLVTGTPVVVPGRSATSLARDFNFDSFLRGAADQASKDKIFAGDWTIAWSMKQAALVDGYQGIFGLSGDEGNWALRIAIDNQTLFVGHLWASGGSSDVSQPWVVNPPTGTFNRFHLTCADGMWELWMNGVSFGSLASSSGVSAMAVTTPRWQLARVLTDDGVVSIDAALDDIVFYDRPLSPAEIQADVG